MAQLVVTACVLGTCLLTNEEGWWLYCPIGCLAPLSLYRTGSKGGGGGGLCGLLRINYEGLKFHLFCYSV